jgi:hypothetical protein
MKTFVCPACAKGKVAARGGKGRSFPYKQVPALAIDDAFEIPTCDSCGEMFISATLAKRLDAHLERRYQLLLGEVVRSAILKISAEAPQQELEQLLGLSHGYLSKLRNGKKEPSPALVGELMMLAESPRKRVGELRRHWAEAAHRGPRAA